MHKSKLAISWVCCIKHRKHINPIDIVGIKLYSITIANISGTENRIKKFSYRR